MISSLSTKGKHKLMKKMNVNINKYLYLNIYKKYQDISMELEKTKRELEKTKEELEDIKNKKMKVSRCSKEGKKYEQVVYEIVKKCSIVSSENEKHQFNTQELSDLGGCSYRNDLECNYMGEKNIGIEIKKKNTPDWMQCSLKYDIEKNKWIGSNRNKIPKESKKIFELLLEKNNSKIFNGKIPPFIKNSITHEDWLKLKSETGDFNDQYFECPEDTIKNLYNRKGCNYIQISEMGLYHLGEDKCGFNVPEFKCPQKLRIRTKIHNRKNKKGFCNLSVTLSCMPVNIDNLYKSNYSLDDSIKLPKNLINIDCSTI